MQKYLQIYQKGFYLNAAFKVRNIPFSFFRIDKGVREFKTSYKLKNEVECKLLIRVPNELALPILINNKNVRIKSDLKSIQSIYVRARTSKLSHRDILNLDGGSITVCT